MIRYWIFERTDGGAVKRVGITVEGQVRIWDIRTMPENS